MIKFLEANTKYYSITCFTCKRMLQNSKNIEKFYNLDGFPKLLVEIAEILKAKEL
jgi:hypothetical protein